MLTTITDPAAPSVKIVVAASLDTSASPLDRSPLDRSPLGRSPLGRSPLGRSPSLQPASPRSRPSLGEAPPTLPSAMTPRCNPPRFLRQDRLQTPEVGAPPYARPGDSVFPPRGPNASCPVGLTPSRPATALIVRLCERGCPSRPPETREWASRTLSSRRYPPSQRTQASTSGTFELPPWDRPLLASILHDLRVDDRREVIGLRP